MVAYSQITTTFHVLTEEGREIAASGSHEFRVWQALPEKGAGEPVSIPELKVNCSMLSMLKRFQSKEMVM